MVPGHSRRRIIEDQSYEQIDEAACYAYAYSRIPLPKDTVSRAGRFRFRWQLVSQ